MIIRFFRWWGRNTNLNSSSQSCHFLVSMVLIGYGGLFFGFYSLWFTIPLMLAFAAWKEFWFDPRYETREVAGSDLLDFSFYMLGIALAVALVMTKAHVRAGRP